METGTTLSLNQSLGEPLAVQRPSLRESLSKTKPRGKDVFFTDTDTTPTNNEQSSTTERKQSTLADELFTVDEPQPTWNDLHQRVTFYCPKDLVEEVESIMQITRKSKSQVIVIALESSFNKKRRK